MSHSYTFLCTHFVFSTKGRVPLLTPNVIPRLLDYTGGIVRASRCVLLAANAVADYVHLLADVHPSTAHADLMREVKARTSSFVREAFPDAEWAGWQNGYGGFSVSRSGIDAVKAYIARQEEHHRHMSFKEEFIALLEKHGIEYDERYVWGE
ncbi:MAG TPA: IS200/IS605 family transposase [Phycisphaerales bacterium]|nr:IS200/IS605 family transposase [Phycisphaerales bacterium]